MNKLFKLSLICFISFFTIKLNVYAVCEGTTTWDLVDGGNKIHWSGSTSYSSQWNYAVYT